MTDAERVAWLYGLQHFGVKLGLDNIRGLLALLGHPERAYRSVIVAGTNGKGSVAAMIDAILAAAGIRSGLFTSPHLVRPHERIRIAGEDITADAFDRLLGHLRSTIEAGLAQGLLEAHPSFFEVITATALEAFRENRLDVAVLEVGLGGRLDATNAVDADVAAIVSVDLDHTKTLGSTIPAIAAEKAGVIKSGQPVVSGVTQQGAVDVVRRICREKGAHYVDARQAVQLTEDREGSFDLRGALDYRELRLALAGRHQIDNARVAVAAVEQLARVADREIDARAVRTGLVAVRWPGRLQWVRARDVDFLLDAAHNPAGMATLIGHLAGAERRPGVLLFGATSGKPVEQLLAPLGRWIRRAVITRPPVDRGLATEDVGRMARSVLPETVAVETEDDLDRALERASAIARDLGDAVLVTGSLYLVGDVLGRLSGATDSKPIAM